MSLAAASQTARAAPAERPDFEAELADASGLGDIERPLPWFERLLKNEAVQNGAILVGLALAWELYARYLDNPLLLPSFAIVLVLRTIETFKVFDIIYIMTRGGPASGTQTIAFYTYLEAFSNQRFGYGSAVAYVIVIAVAVLASIYLRLLRRSEGSLL